jgi:hypothetical protein
MKKCKCGDEVAGNPNFCPRCGHRFTHPFVMVSLSFSFWEVVGAIISEAVNANPIPAQTSSPNEKENTARAVLGARSLRSAMRNPDAFKLEQALVMSNCSVCYVYRAQNGFGGMNRGHAVLTGKGQFKSDEMAGFSALWKRECANKTGGDETFAGRLLPQTVAHGR